MGKVKAMLMEQEEARLEMLDKSLRDGGYEHFSDWASQHPDIDEHELREHWDEFWAQYQ